MKKIIDPDYFKKLAQIESSNNPNAKAKTSSAAGLYQFTEGTWKDLVKQLDLDYNLDDRYDPDKSRVVIEKFTEDNRKYLETRLNRPVNDGELYLAHFLGRKGAIDLLSNVDAGSNLVVGDAVSENAIKANPSIFLNKDGSQKSVFDIYDWANKKMGAQSKKKPSTVPYSLNQAYSNEEGNIIPSKDVERLDNSIYDTEGLSYLPNQFNIEESLNTPNNTVADLTKSPDPELEKDNYKKNYSFTQDIKAFKDGGFIQSDCGGPGQPPCEKKKDNTITNINIKKNILKPSSKIINENKELEKEDFKSKDTSEFFKYIKSFKSNEDYKKFVKLHNENGNPSINSNPLNKRANYNSLTNTINISDNTNIKDYLEELAHSKQNKEGSLNFLNINNFKGYYNELLNSIDGKKRDSHYKNPKTSEYDAHSNISPKLRKQVGEDLTKLKILNIDPKSLIENNFYNDSDIIKIKNFLGKEGMFSINELDSNIPKEIILKNLEEYQKLNSINNILPKNTYKLGGLIDPPSKKAVVNDSKNFVKNWFNDSTTKAKYSMNTGKGFNYTLPKLDEGLKRLDTTSINYDAPTNDESLGAEYKNNNINFFKTPTPEDATHEFTHVMGVDKDLSKYIRDNYGTPASAIQKKTGLNFQDAIKKEFNIDDSTFLGRDQLQGTINHSRYLSENGELYPRIMEIRKTLNVKPGDIITDEQIKSLEGSDNPLFKYYSPEQIKDILNTVADNNSGDNTYAVLGGTTSSNTNILNQFNSGGKHHENPLGGIPLGQNSEGGTNFVEEGETQYEDYIFSDTLKITKDNIQENNLPEEFVGLTFSEASKKINKQIEDRPFDKLSKKTAEGMFNQLTLANEKERIKIEDMKKKKDKKMFLGGEESPEKPGIGTYLGLAEGALGIGQNLFGRTGVDTTGASGKMQKIDQTGSTVSGALSGAKLGASLGPIGAIGGLVAGGLGGFFGSKRKNNDIQQNNNNHFLSQSVSSNFASGGSIDPTNPFNLEKEKNKYRSLIQGNNYTDATINPFFDKKDFPGQLNKVKNHYRSLLDSNDYEAAKQNPFFDEKDFLLKPRKERSLFDLPDYNTFMSDNTPTPSPIDNTGAGPNTSSNTSSTIIDNTPTLTKLTGRTQGYTGIDNNFNTPSNINSLLTNTVSDNSNSNSIDDSEDKDSKFNLNNLLRYAPSIGSALQLLNAPKAEQETLDRLNGRYNPQYADLNSITNRIKDTTANVRRGVLDASAGNANAARSGLLAAQANEARAISDAMFQGENINRQENSIAQSFNQKNDVYNLNQSNSEKQINAQNRAAASQQKQMLWNSLLGDLGNIGKENVQGDILEKLTGYGFRGNKVKESGGFLTNLYDSMQDKDKQEIKNFLDNGYN